jgi:uncharacterized protein (DUF1501 family)
MPKQMTRRKFLQGCSFSIASLAGARLTNLAYAADEDDADTLVVVFLRGGWDALNVVPPLDGKDRGFYEESRPVIKVASKKLLNLNDQFGLHPGLSPLFDLYQAGQMGIVHAVGLDFDTRSHFDAMEYIELGTPGNKSTTSGWITRHLQTRPGSLSGLLPVMASPSQPTALLNTSTAVSMSQISDLSQWDNGYLDRQQMALKRIYAGKGLLQEVGRRTLDAVQSVAPLVDQNYTPQNGAVYPEDEFGRQMQTVARLIKMDAGLRVATVDFGGWDTHERQNDGEGGYLGGLLGSLAAGLANFYLDLDNQYTRRLSVVVISEFGRRLIQNNSDGTDHGHGSVMLALGANVNGGQVFGNWPGLQSEQLYDRADLAVTTDYRQVLSELLTKRMKNTAIDQVFPGYTGPQNLDLYRA